MLFRFIYISFAFFIVALFLDVFRLNSLGHGEEYLGETATGLDIYDYPEEGSFVGYEAISCPPEVDPFLDRAAQHWSIGGANVTDRSYAMYGVSDTVSDTVLVVVLHIDAPGHLPHVDTVKCFRENWHSWLTW